MYGFAGLIFKKIKEKESLFTWRDTVAGILLGLPNYGSIYFLIKVLQIPNLNASIAFPINNLGIVVLSFLLSIFLFKEKPETLKILGFCLALVAIALMIF
jgi:drug/metabolite transporter (DMT)-like permease